MAEHTDHISRSAYLEISRISPVCHLLMRKATVQLMCFFALCRLDYCNSLLTDITSDQMCSLKKNSKSCSQSCFLQKQTSACYITSQKVSLTPSQRKDTFQDSYLCLSFFLNVFYGTLPSYLSSCLSVYTPSCTLYSSSNEKTLSCAKWKFKDFGHQSFSVQAPHVWNSLPPHI